MKQRLLVALSITFIIACNSAPASVKEKENAFDADKEQTAIMSVIEKETASFFAGDYNGWKSTRSQQPYDFQAWNNSDGTFDVENGWQQIDTSIKKYIEDNKAPVVTRPEMIRKNLQCKFLGTDYAYLTWTEYVQHDTAQEFYSTRDVRLMEKQNGEWKIVTVASYWDYKNKLQKNNIQ